jgi:hypothetical protein
MCQLEEMLLGEVLPSRQGSHNEFVRRAQCATARVIGQTQPRHCHQQFLRFLKAFDAATPAQLDVY